MKPCPFTGCGRQTFDDSLACAVHAGRLTQPERRQADQLRRQYLAGQLGEDQYREACERMVEALEWRTA